MWSRKTFLLKCVALQYAKIGVSEYYISFDFSGLIIKLKQWNQVVDVSILLKPLFHCLLLGTNTKKRGINEMNAPKSF